MEENEIYSFNVELLGSPSSDGTKPIYDIFTDALVGGFTLRYGNTISGFLSKKAAPFLNLDQDFFFTPNYVLGGEVTGGFVSDSKISEDSIRIPGGTND